MTNAAILFEPEGYLLDGPKLMGRQAAGNAFLRAAVAGRQQAPLWAYTPHRRSAEVFQKLVTGLDPQADARWLPADRLDMLAKVGALYLPGPGLDAAAKLRLRAGPAAYSLTGVTHTTASHGAMDSIVGMLHAPVMPWDALICTSNAVLQTVRQVLGAEVESLRWQFGAAINISVPQLPVIPLGVHCDDFIFTPEERTAARAALGIAADEVVALFVGRLSFHAKAHPHAMYLGLQAAARQSGKKVTLLQSGWFANDAIEQSFRSGAALACPDVRCLYSDGRDADRRRQCWAVADIFISLSDNVQETFGLTPIEAMAAGIPLVVTDWDGYKDTVREGVDGFRIPTWMPPPNLGERFALRYESGIENYDMYCGLICQTVALDRQALAERLTLLVNDPALRRQFGQAGQQRARTTYDWSVVYRQYQALWAELGRLRASARTQPDWQARLAAAPGVAAGRQDPFVVFGHYPSALMQPVTLVSRQPDASLAQYRQLAGHGLFSYAASVLPAAEEVEKLLHALENGPIDLRTLSAESGIELSLVALAVAILAKMGLLALKEP